MLSLVFLLFLFKKSAKSGFNVDFIFRNLNKAFVNNYLFWVFIIFFEKYVIEFCSKNHVNLINFFYINTASVKTATQIIISIVYLYEFILFVFFFL